MDEEIGSHNFINVDISTRQYIIKHSFVAIFFVLLFVLAAGVIVLYIGWLLTLVLLIIIPFVSFAYIRDKTDYAFVEQFAKQNGYTLDHGQNESITPVSTYLKMGRNQYIDHVMTGLYGRFPLRIYTFNTTIGDEKDPEQLEFSVFEISYPGTVMNMLLDTGNHILDKSLIVGKKLELEGNFNNYFDVYVPEGSEIEALMILTPDVMEQLIVKSRKYSIEISNNKLFIYTEREINNSEELEAVSQFAEAFITQIGPTLERIKPV